MRSVVPIPSQLRTLAPHAMLRPFEWPSCTMPQIMHSYSHDILSALVAMFSYDYRLPALPRPLCIMVAGTMIFPSVLVHTDYLQLVMVSTDFLHLVMVLIVVWAARSPALSCLPQHCASLFPSGPT